MSGEYGYNLSNYAGLNLDIAHWNLAGIKSGDIAETSNKDGSDIIRKHIVHCHVSDHGRGHFADLIPGTVNSKQHFTDWMKAIKGLNNNKFSRTVALELEACKNADYVHSSLDIINSILCDISQYPKLPSPPQSFWRGKIINPVKDLLKIPIKEWKPKANKKSRVVYK